MPSGELTFRSLSRSDDGLIRVAETYTPDGKETEYEFSMRPWSRDELESLLRGAGMSDVKIRRGEGRRVDRMVAIARPRRKGARL